LIPPKQYVILNACDSNEEQRIDKRSAHRATAKMVREYERLIHREDLELLAQVHRERRFPGSSDLSRLMYNRLVLPYINSAAGWTSIPRWPPRHSSGNTLDWSNREQRDTA
jgi:hypothetical protein